MERYSTWRDGGTGIIPFVVPVQAATEASSPLLYALLPLQGLLGAVRLLLFFIFVILSYALTSILSLILAFAPAISQQVQAGVTAVFLRLSLFLCFGFYWISEEVASTTRRSASNLPKPKPKAGDLVISNYSSFIDVLYLAYKYQPVFLLPRFCADKTFQGYNEAGLVSILAYTGHTPSSFSSATPARNLDAILSRAKRPVVVFPECTTSNNRALLRFAKLPAASSASKSCKAHILALRYDPPSTLLPTATHPIPALRLNPLLSMLKVCMTPLAPPRTLSVKMLTPAEAPSPTSADFWAKAGSSIASIGKLKQTGLGWEEKDGFLEYYRKGSHGPPRTPRKR